MSSSKQKNIIQSLDYFPVMSQRAIRGNMGNRNRTLINKRKAKEVSMEDM